MHNTLEDARNLTIIVIGDIILDEYIDGTVERMSPEAPVPVVNKSGTRYALGGAANVAANIQSLGAQSILVGTLGTDTYGDLLTSMISQQLHQEAAIIHTQKRSTVKSRVIVEGKQVLRIDDEDAEHLNDQETDLLLDRVRQIIEDYAIDGIILQDYNKGVLYPRTIRSILSLAQESKIPTFVDPKYENYWDYVGCTLFKPNKKELYHAIHKPMSSATLCEVMQATWDKLQCEALICTLAAEGIAAITQDGYEVVAAEKVEIADVSGAGDSTLSMIVIGYLLRFDLKKTLTYGNLAGKLACMQSEVNVVTVDQMNEHIHQ